MTSWPPLPVRNSNLIGFPPQEMRGGKVSCREVWASGLRGTAWPQGGPTAPLEAPSPPVPLTPWPAQPWTCSFRASPQYLGPFSPALPHGEPLWRERVAWQGTSQNSRWLQCRFSLGAASPSTLCLGSCAWGCAQKDKYARRGLVGS